ncbi:MAG: hypothetical protein COV60_01945 [Candidatus Magasanikbacteria bacterium CG11_big_fil_rev_8_21_14_0_20_43_7]|uniref:L,D-TPase catalytic domain-containing protein n=1 Tax=Candidatus Magasanikbacteria bacterium CG11_big_fil_rev_8_21_14_0_20_43_7 TaxID=1974654 RepID=A0A2H0N2J2_9BACT|nr:MAG: hypothetical protein COV60_01945 [Candidatus Magasanikbacteria bacterium CG11_big_fil_rev_8_21_14_0_20_43_7]
MGILAFCISPVFVYATLDTDNDGLSDEQESYYYTDPYTPDTDGDGYLDGIEVQMDYSPHLGDGKRMNESDFDKDGLNDWLERWFGSDSGVADTDENGETDYDAVMRGYSPVSGTTTVFAREVIVDRTYQRLYYNTDGVKIHNFPISTGNPGSETPKGDFVALRKIPDKRYVGPGYDLSGVKWNVEFKPMYYLHAAYWHNDFGLRTHSHGCVNMRESDAKIVFDYIDAGVPIRVVGETPMGYLVGT